MADTAGLHITLTAAEAADLTGLAEQFTGDIDGPRAHDFFRQAPVYAQTLPLRLRQALLGLRQAENAGYAVITGLQVDDEAIGDTPDRWQDPAARERTRLASAQLALLGSLVGELFGWSSQQDGAVIHDVLPMREYENTQINFASKEPIWWHTEDAFHAFRPDYVGLMCMRNPQNAATTVSCAADWDLDDPRYNLLFEEWFRQRPDNAHGVESQSMKPRALLTGDRRKPYVCVDPYFLEPVADAAVAAVLKDFYGKVEDALRAVVLQPGDVVIVDNYRAVHGRKPFQANYDGRDRWLKRMSVRRDLRHSWPAWSAASRQVLDGNDN